MACGSSSLYDAVSQRMDGIMKRMDELEMKLILAAMRSETKGTKDGGNPPQDAKVGKGKGVKVPPAETKETPIGWTTVTRKNGKGKGKTSPPTSRPPLRLRPDDWEQPILDKANLKPGAIGVCEVSIKGMSDLWRMLKGTSENLVLITEERFPDASEDCKEFDCRYLTAEDRVVLRKRWCTNLGKGKAIPKHRAPESGIPVFSINNDTVKIVIHITQAESGKSWEQPLNNPGAAVRGWLKEINIEKNLVHSYRPVLKGEGDTKYRQPLLDEFRIVWIGLGEDLKSTLAKSYLLGDKNRGLAFSRNGLGIRVLKVHYEECGKKLLGDLFKPASTGT